MEPIFDDGFEEKVVDELSKLYELTDKEGNTLTYRLYEGHRYIPPFPDDIPGLLKDIANFPCREDDIFLATYPKCGLHWITNIIRMLVSRTTEYHGSPPYIEFDRDLSRFDNMESPRILSAHIDPELLPRELIHGNKGQIINITRNPKDNVVSFYTFIKNMQSAGPHLPIAYKGDFNGFLKLFLSGRLVCDSWFDYYNKWQKIKENNPDHNILCLVYEDMQTDLYGHIVKIADFLKIKCTEEFLRKVEEKTTFKSMKSASSEMKASAEFQTVLPIYRKGTVGDWKNWFTVAQNELFDKVYAEKMGNNASKFVFE